MKKADLMKMTSQERLELMEQIWDSFTTEDGEIQSPPWHEAVLAERRQDVASGEAGFITLDELRALNKG